MNQRRCRKCGCFLSRYNPESYCSVCGQKRRKPSHVSASSELALERKRGDERYPKAVPVRLKEDLKAAKLRYGKALTLMRRSPKLHASLIQFRQELMIPKEGLAPKELERWLQWLYKEHCQDELSQFASYLRMFARKRNELVTAHNLDAYFDAFPQLQRCFFLKSRYWGHEASLEGYYIVESDGKREFGYHTTHQLRRFLPGWIDKGIPGTVPIHFESEDSRIFDEKLWRLSLDVDR